LFFFRKLTTSENDEITEVLGQLSLKNEDYWFSNWPSCKNYRPCTACSRLADLWSQGRRCEYRSTAAVYQC